MHMADTLISPVVGSVMWAVSSAAMIYSVKKIKDEDIFEGKKIPLTGVAGAFIFAAQMVNFTIPATGSSGHLVGGLLLAALLGPHAGFLVMSVVLAIQALFFNDGGLLALGCNIFNMGFISCYIVFPLIYRLFVRNGYTKKRIMSGSITSSVLAMTAGAAGIVLQTAASGITDLPIAVFTLFMLPIHIVLGIIEGLITAAVLIFIYNNQPGLLDPFAADRGTSKGRMKILGGFAAATLILAGGLVLISSSYPDGLEWSLARSSSSFADTEDEYEESHPLSDISAGLAGSASVLVFTGACAGAVYYVKNKRRSPSAKASE